MCVLMIVYNCGTLQHGTVLIIFRVILQTVITAQMMSVGGERCNKLMNYAVCC